MLLPPREDLIERIESLSERLSDVSLVKQPSILKDITHQLRRAKETLAAVDDVTRLAKESAECAKLLTSTDLEIRALAEEESLRLQEAQKQAQQSLEELLIPEDPLNSRDIILEIRAGAGGQEASLFGEELLRAYIRYAEMRGWRVTSLGDGVVEISGEEVYGHFKYESGVHRVQRIPETEKMGRTHTSTVTVAILPRAEEEDVRIRSEDLRIDVYRASGAGGQHVNKTSSAVRITHIPTGMMVACQQERSQHKNKEKAMSLLRARLLAAQEEARHAKEAKERKSQIGTGDRSEKIRTYNFPQDRITDHRIKESWSNIAGVMEGALDPIFQSLQAKDRENRLQAAI